MFLALALACTHTTLGDAPMVLLDADALDAGWAVEVDGRVVSTALPVPLWYEGGATLIAPDGASEEEEVFGGELLLVEGADGELDWLAIGTDVAPDVVLVEGTEDAAFELADQAGAEVLELDGAWQLSGRELLEELCYAKEPDGLVGVRPSWDVVEVLDETEDESFSRRMADLEDAVGMLKTRSYRNKLDVLDLDAQARSDALFFVESRPELDRGELDPASLVGVWHSGARCLVLDASGGFHSCDGAVEGPWEVNRGLLLVGEASVWAPHADGLEEIATNCDGDCPSIRWSRP